MTVMTTTTTDYDDVTLLPVYIYIYISLSTVPTPFLINYICSAERKFLICFHIGRSFSDRSIWHSVSSTHYRCAGSMSSDGLIILILYGRDVQLCLNLLLQVAHGNGKDAMISRPPICVVSFGFGGKLVTAIPLKTSHAMSWYVFNTALSESPYGN